MDNKRRKLAGLVAATVATLTVTSGSMMAQAKVGAILGADETGAIENSYIVVLKDAVSAQSTQTVAKGVAQRHGGDVERVYSSALDGYSATMSERQAKRTAADPAVAYVEQNRTVTLSAAQPDPASWGLDRIDQRDLPLNDQYKSSTTASNVSAYILDTGINVSHNDFGGRAEYGYDFVDDDANADDCNGHGTHVAGTLGGSSYGVAKGVTLYAVRVLDCLGTGSYAGIIDGIDWVTRNAQKPAVANMSLGGGASEALDDAVRRSISSGVTYALAAGNDRGADACDISPARTTEALTVGATTRGDVRSGFSNIGTCLDMFAPGTRIISAWIGSDSASNMMSGTSMATPHVAGGAALFLADHPSASPQQVRDTLVSNGTKDEISDVGTGSPNVLVYTGDYDNTPPENPAPPEDPAPPEEPAPSQCARVGNTGNVSIPDNGPAVTSSVTISGCDGKASSSTEVEVHVEHSMRGDLVIDLVAPDGTSFRLKNASILGLTSDVHTTYTVNASAESVDGDWQLKVQDVSALLLGLGSGGHVDSWTLSP